VVIETQSPEAVAAGVRVARELGAGGGERARARVLQAFTIAHRRAGLLALAATLTGGSPAAAELARAA
jgi:hypothetical protein